MLGSLSCLLVLLTALVAGQRGSFAGFRPIGFPDTPNRTTTTPDPLADRFGEGSTQRLPVEANGDWDLVDRLSKLPVDKQPFWYINWQQLEEQRKNPQTFAQKPNTFVDSTSNQGSNNQGFLVNNNQGTTSSGFANNVPIVTNPSPVLVNNNYPSTTNSYPSVPSNPQPVLTNIKPSVTIISNPGISNNPALSTPQGGTFYSDILPKIDDYQGPSKNNSSSNNNNAGLPTALTHQPVFGPVPNNNQKVPNTNTRKPTTAMYTIVDTSISNNNNGPVNSQNTQPIPKNQRVPINFLGLQNLNNRGVPNNPGRPINNPQATYTYASTFSDNNGPIDSYGNPINNGYTNPNIELSYPNSFSNSGPSNTKEVVTNPTAGFLHQNPALLNPYSDLISPGLVNQARPSGPSQGTIKTEFSTSSPSITTFHAPPLNVSTSKSNSKRINTNTGFVDPNTGLSVQNKDSKFSTASSSFASSSSLGDRSGDNPTSYNYNYNWNNSFHHQFLSLFNYRTNSTPVAQNEARQNHNYPRYY